MSDSPESSGATPMRVDATSSRLASASLTETVRILSTWRPPDAQQDAERERMLAFAEAHPDALLRSCLEGHFTASGLVLDARGERALLTHHRKLGRWLQLGGHCDGEGNLARAALTEATEESGIDGIVIHPTPVDVDIHVIPARPGEPEHLHLDTRFLMWAPEGAVERVGEESLDLGWFTARELEAVASDASVLRLFERAGLR